MDAHPGILHWSDGQVVRPRIQSYDSTFTTKKTQSITLHKAGVAMTFPSRLGESVFRVGRGRRAQDRHRGGDQGQHQEGPLGQHRDQAAGAHVVAALSIFGTERAARAALSRSREDAPVRRCGWAPETDPLYLAYHDEEWGVPSHDERHLFELLVLEGAQAGLSWSTILHKREGYRRAFAGFDVETVARLGPRDVERLLADPGIVRNRLKVESAVANAQATIAAGGLDELLWSFVGGTPRVNRWSTLAELPADTGESRAMSKELKRRGFRFVGPTVCYSLMQACGLVNDHLVGCFRYAQIRHEA